MSQINLLSKSRSTLNLFSRILTVIGRFGISSKRFEHLLNEFNATTRNLGCRPTFAITAVILERHPRLMKRLSQQGIEFAIHGYIHIDYKVLTEDEQYIHCKKAIESFNTCGIPFMGFRAPFLRVNSHTSEILSKLGFIYHSSRVMHWPVVDLSGYSKYARNNHDRLNEFYNPKDANVYLSLPKRENGIVEIPVSIPDDEVMVDRLGIRDKKTIANIWQAILQRTYQRGELFTVQLHPERISFCETALVNILNMAAELDPPVWVATLGEITKWWKQRATFTFEINSQGNNRYGVQAYCSENATLLIRNGTVDVPVSEWANGYQSINARHFVVESPARPVIGVGLDSSPAAVSFLRNEGFIVEQSHQPGDYGIYFGNLAQFDEADEKPLSEEIDKSDAPLLRYWRWPDRARSAMSITGDIDSLTLIDFVLRVFETWRQNRR